MSPCKNPDGEVLQNPTLFGLQSSKLLLPWLAKYCVGRDLLKPNLGKLLGSGIDTPIWRTPWLSLSSPLSPMGPPTEASKDLTVAALLIPDTQAWNLQLIRSILPCYEEGILNLRPSKCGALDTWAWLPAADGIFSTKSSYYEALNAEKELPYPPGASDPPGFDWKSSIWNPKCSPKIKLLLWKSALGALPVGTNLQFKHISGDTFCPHCGEEESELHLFFKCSFFALVWKLAPFKEYFNPETTASMLDGISLS